MVRADDLDDALRARLDAIRDALSAYDVLVQERKTIEALIDLRSRSNPGRGLYSQALASALDAGKGSVPTPLTDALQVSDSAGKAAFERKTVPPPVYREDTKTARLLHHAQTMVLRSPKRELPFLEIFDSIPDHLRGSGRHFREHFRSILQRAGDRVDLQYVDAEHVRFVKPGSDESVKALSFERIGVAN